VAYAVANLERSSTWQAETDTYLRVNGVNLCVNDYTTTNVNVVRNLFAPPTASNPNPRPVFVIINCVSNSTSHPQQWQVLAKDINTGGSSIDLSARLAAWRNLIDSVQAPPPRITGARRAGDSFEFIVPGQRGRTNRVEWTTDFAEWTTITNLFGTNAAITIRDTNASMNPSRSYRVVRP